jgi:oxygen-dependent protoporphyrinogen oxidase
VDLCRHSDQEWQATLAAEPAAAETENLVVDAVCLALPAYCAADLLCGTDPNLAAGLRDIAYASAATVNLAYRSDDVPRPLDGFGFVVPEIEGRQILGCTFSSVKFAGRAPTDHALLRAFLAGSTIDGKTGADVEQIVRRELHDLLGISAPPLFSLTSRHDRAMPQYRVGHREHVAEIQSAAARHPGLALAGNAYRGIGIPDCVHSGEQAAEHLMGCA